MNRSVLKKKTNMFLIFCAALIEWIEFSIYSYLSPLLSGLFFPNHDVNTGIILTYAIFALSYCVRPLAGIIFGKIADTVGRKNVLLFSILLMAISTISIGVLPTYETIGILAPILLLICRIFQSFAVAVEFNVSSMYFIESADRNPMIASSWLTSASCGGMGIGALIIAFSNFTALSCGWRLPFLITGILSLIIYGFRQYLPESPVFLQAYQQQQLVENPVREVILKHKKALLIIGLLAAYVGVFMYVGHVYLTTFLVQIGAYTLQQATKIGAVTEIGIAVLTPCFASFLRSVSAFKVLKVGVLMMAIVGPLLFWSATQGLYAGGFIASVGGYIIADAVVSSCIFYYIYSLVPASVRCTILGLSWSLCLSIVGGTAPMIAACLVQAGWILGPGIYMATTGILVFLGLLWTKNPEQILQPSKHALNHK